jgi:outer membrane protein assembly factor BamD (BamD/ComL family)
MMVAEKLVTVEREARLISLYKAGRRAMENGLWEEALNHFNVIVELEPGYKDTEVLLSEAHQALKEEDAQQFVATRYREGVAHFEAERWKNAVQAFEEVQQFEPGFEQVEQLLAEARPYSNPSLLQKLTGNKNALQDLWRWGLVVAGVIAIVFLSFLAFGNNNQASGDDDVKQHLKLLYEEAQLAIENGNTAEAVAKLEQILSEDPDYADVAELRRELIATPTPLPTSTPTPLPTPTIVVVISTPEEDPLADFLDEAQTAVDVAQWSEAIETLNQVRTEEAEYQKARVASLFCDAYVGRGLEMLANIGPQEQESEIIGLALIDFGAGVVECPRRTDLKEQAERAAAYLEALNTPDDDHETLIPILVPIVAADPDYASRNAKKLLFNAYLDRAEAREQTPETLAAALGDYEAALALNVDDPSEAHLRRAELLLLFSQGPVQPTSEPVETPTRSSEEVSTPVVGVTPSVVPTPTAEPVRIIYKKPKLIAPEDDAHFAGQFSEVILEWEPAGELAADEYYDLTIMHLFADEPQYTGSTRTRETRMQINPGIGVGEAGGDRFYWWVTVRKDNTAPWPDGLDLPLSLRSDAGTFVWTP